MIVASLLLILVAVTLLVLGLTGGSSGLLISSIVASLLAAVLLVVGARQAAAARRASPTEPLAPPQPDDNTVFVAEPEFAAAAEEVNRRRAPEDVLDDQRETVQFDPVDVAAAKPSDGPDFTHARAVDQPDAATTSVMADQAGAPAGDLSADEPPRAERHDQPDPPRAERHDQAEPPRVERHDQAEQHDRSAAGQGDERLAEPAADDPDDEPLPQSVQPADAVRLARLDAEVLVVDGRPRYHVSDCPSLAGRLTEPIPVREAVELGFSPCGLCRPVDRLVGAAARR